MNKRQPTFLKPDTPNHILTAVKSESVRTHVLDKANSLQQDIASLDDPSITELYQLLTSELQASSQPDENERPISTSVEAIASTEDHGVAKRPETKMSTTEVALYVHNLTKELRDICLSVDLKFLAYLVDMARVEANSILAHETSEPTCSTTSTSSSQA